MIDMNFFEKIWSEILLIKNEEYNTVFSERTKTWENKVGDLLQQKKFADEGPASIERCHDEVFSLGPLTALINNTELTEILVNDLDQIWFEKDGKLTKHLDRFYSRITFKNILERMCQEAKVHINTNHPFADSQFRDFRFSLVGAEVSNGKVQLSLRRHPENPWSLDKLQESGWAPSQELQKLKDLMLQKKNFLVVGGTGSGKTSVTNAMLELVSENERVLVIEDTLEIKLPNGSCTRLLTRVDPHGELPEINQEQLVKRALRLRPDRIVLGEIRGGEAKDLLLALTSGHQGCFSTLHANSAAQALIRLEMLIQIGAPQWSILSVRRLIQMSLDALVITEKNADGHRRLKGIYKISSLEEQGFLIDPL